jgi:hypothetical protein
MPTPDGVDAKRTFQQSNFRDVWHFQTTTMLTVIVTFLFDCHWIPAQVPSQWRIFSSRWSIFTSFVDVEPTPRDQTVWKVFFRRLMCRIKYSLHRPVSTNAPRKRTAWPYTGPAGHTQLMHTNATLIRFPSLLENTWYCKGSHGTEECHTEIRKKNKSRFSVRFLESFNNPCTSNTAPIMVQIRREDRGECVMQVFLY